MRLLIAAAAVMIAGSAFAVENRDFQLNNAAGLVEICSVPAEDPLYINAREFCHGYLVGAFQYYDATEPPSNRFVCAPNPRPSRAEVMQRFVQWAKDHPQYMADRPVDTLFRHLAESYPCKN